MFNALSNAFHSVFAKPQAVGRGPASQGYAQQRPNFNFQGTGKPATGGHTNWQFVGGSPPVTNDVKLPQNLDFGKEWSMYGDRQGNKWMENNNTGKRIPVPAPKPQYDTPLPKFQNMPGQFNFPVQYKSGKTPPKPILT